VPFIVCPLRLSLVIYIYRVLCSYFLYFMMGTVVVQILCMTCYINAMTQKHMDTLHTSSLFSGCC
jgi:hypothetical protein